MKFKDENHIPALIDKFRALNGRKVDVGIIGGDDSEVAEYAAANEFGTTEAGANKDVTIPERSFLRSTFDDDNAVDKAFTPLAKLFDVADNADITLERMGLRMVGEVRRKITSNIPPPNAPSTRKRKKKTRTLVDTGWMKQSISHEVK